MCENVSYLKSYIALNGKIHVPGEKDSIHKERYTYQNVSLSKMKFSSSPLRIRLNKFYRVSKYKMLKIN